MCGAVDAAAVGATFVCAGTGPDGADSCDVTVVTLQGESTALSLEHVSGLVPRR